MDQNNKALSLKFTQDYFVMKSQCAHKLSCVKLDTKNTKQCEFCKDRYFVHGGPVNSHMVLQTACRIKNDGF